ncbi:hypothetical protein HD553DRAFT_337938 [Filobasidium floriforme]|uniref:uncharacterized protein n=1 Tax=Filobasidium floriforme TaxID=5210 RepID=UPI001E8EDE50|nr:uncharacterized protein HD553DRAFT_337938 [Filobasidium floriforme]KAH8090253.1 hypothetical protein HD553DRAFT_337938 [Filobasidium floriforme]
MSCPPCNQPSARITDALNLRFDVALDRARDLKQVVITKLAKLTPRHWVWFVVGALLLGCTIEVVERYFPQLAPKANSPTKPEPANEDEPTAPVQFGPTRLPMFGEDDWFIYTEIRIEAWLMRTLKAGRAPLVGQDEFGDCHGDDQRCDQCEGLDKADYPGLEVEVEVEGDRLAESVVAPSDAVTTSPVVSELDVLPSISSDVDQVKTVQPAFASSESLVEDPTRKKDEIEDRPRYPVRDRDLNKILATVPRKRVSVDLELDSDDEAREASEERTRYREQLKRRAKHLNTVIEAWRKGVPMDVDELDAPAPIPRPAAPTPRAAAARIDVATEKRRLQRLSIHLMPDTLEGWTALVGSGSERIAPDVVLSRSRRPSAALVGSGSRRQPSAVKLPPPVDVDVEKAVAQAMFEFKTTEPIMMTWAWNDTVPLIAHRRHVSAPTMPLPERPEDRRVSFKSLLDWTPKKRVDEDENKKQDADQDADEDGDEDLLIPALTQGSCSPTGTDLSTPSTPSTPIRVCAQATAMIEVSRKLAEFQKMRTI